MVNLAKLRKKAKQSKEPSAAAEGSHDIEQATPAATRADSDSAPASEQASPAASPPAPARKDVKTAPAAASDVAGTGDSTERSDEEAPSESASGGPGDPTEDRIARYLQSAGETRGQIARQEAIDTGERLELLTFVIAGEQYAIDIDDVVEIVTPRPVTRIPNADASIVGILSLRGTIVMLMDARRRLRHPAATSIGPDARIIVVKQDAETIGFAVDRVLRVVKVEPSAVGPHPVVHSSEHDDSVRGVFRQGDALTILLDLRKLLSTNDGWN